MKALFFVNSIGNGGAERVCINMAQYIVDKGGRVDFVTLFKSDEYNYIYICKHECLELDPSLKRMEVISNIIKNKGKIIDFVDKNEIDGKYELITAHLPLSHICANITVGNRVLYVQHTSLLYNDKSIFYKLFYKHKNNICVSKGLQEEFINYMNVKSEKCYCVYNPIVLDNLKEKAKEPIDFHKPYFLCVGRLSREKRFDRAIEIFHAGKWYENYYLVILGKGDLEYKLRELAINYGIEEKVIFKGWTDNVYSWMKNSSLVLQTSEREAFPMILIEALASGTRVVASNCEYGAEEIMLGNLSEFIADESSIDDYNKKIKMALDSYPIDDNPRILSECTAEKITNQYLSIYKRICR